MSPKQTLPLWLSLHSSSTGRGEVLWTESVRGAACRQVASAYTAINSTVFPDRCPLVLFAAINAWLISSCTNWSRFVNLGDSFWGTIPHGPVVIRVWVFGSEATWSVTRRSKSFKERKNQRLLSIRIDPVYFDDFTDIKVICSSLFRGIR